MGGGYLLCAGLLQVIPFCLNRISFTKGMNVSPYNSFIIYLESIFLFLTFKDISIKRIDGTFVAKLASLSMASYIFHCQEDLSSFLWRLIHPSIYANTWYLFPVFFAVVLCLYGISIAVEAARRKIMLICNMEDRIENVIYMGLKKVYHYVDDMAMKLLKEWLL